MVFKNIWSLTILPFSLNFLSGFVQRHRVDTERYYNNIKKIFFLNEKSPIIIIF